MWHLNRRHPIFSQPTGLVGLVLIGLWFVGGMEPAMVAGAEEPPLLFTVSDPTRTDWRPEQVRSGRGLVQWRVAGELFAEGPCLPGQPFPMLVGRSGQINRVARAAGLQMTIHAPLAGYAALCPGECAPLTPGQAPAWPREMYDGYHDQDQVAQLLADFTAGYPQLARTRQIGTSHLDRPIWALVISSATTAWEDKPAVVFDGNIHAREYAPTEVCLDLCYQLLTGYAGDARIRAWVDQLQIWIIPCLNPDGRYISANINAMWRKNARDNNANQSHWDSEDGVDLNRNFPLLWGSDNQGSSPYPSSDTYRGPAPASEPETQAYMALIQQLRPAFTLSMHSYWSCFYGSYGDFNLVGRIPEQMDRYGAEVAALAVDEFGRQYVYHGHHLFPYTLNGDLSDWSYGVCGAFALGVELGDSGFQPPYDVVRDQIIPGVRPALFRMLDQATRLGPRVSGYVRDAQGLPLAARVDVLEISAPNDEHWLTRSDGLFQVPLRDAGEYTFTFRTLTPPIIEQALAYTVPEDAPLSVAVTLAEETPTAMPSPTHTPWPLPGPGDADRDGFVTGADYRCVRDHFGAATCGLGDANGDCFVNGLDYLAVRDHFGNTYR